MRRPFAYNLFLVSWASFIFSSCQVWCVRSKTDRNQIISAKFAEDPIIENTIAPYRAKLNESMNESLSYNPSVLKKDGLDNPYFRLICDLTLQQIKTKEEFKNKKINACLLNRGGLRLPVIPKGYLKIQTVFEIMPFENKVIIATLNGHQVRKMFNHLAQSNGHPIAGIRVKVKNKTLVGAQIQGKDVVDTASYHILTSDYLYNGGDKMSFFQDTPYVDTNLNLRDLMIDYFKKTDTLKIDPYDRFIKDK